MFDITKKIKWIIYFSEFCIGDTDDDAINLQKGASNVIIDHCSASWATDGNMDIYSKQGEVSYITFQWNINSEGLQNNPTSNTGRGTNVGEYTEYVSIHHNLYAHNEQRNPQFKFDT